ncbi:MAG: hypothetical protein M1814_000435 [Vezdaea aestivalis]|nr:MAG: hypothetical protein M1814_000435 [Vezdaea aestivalis]
MQLSAICKSTIHSVPSNDGLYIASLITGGQLLIRSALTLDTIRLIPVKGELKLHAKTIRWSPRLDTANENDLDEESFARGLETDDVGGHRPSEGSKATRTAPSSHPRVLLADEETIQVWDVEDVSFSATISKAGDEVKAVNVDFGASSDEIVTWSDCNLRVSIWRLSTGSCVKIRDPKFSNQGYGWRPKSLHFALLARTGAQDLISVHSPVTYALVNTITPVSSDLQGLRWSPDGKWLVSWDSPSRGLNLQIYTADGHLYRNILHSETLGPQGLGIKTADWSVSGDYIVLGQFTNKVSLLSNMTFSERAALEHPTTIEAAHVHVYQELQDKSRQGPRHYDLAMQPISPPVLKSTPSEGSVRAGVSLLSFSAAAGGLMATRADNVPTSLWIWDLEALTLKVVLVHHSPVRVASWHPTIKDLLLIQCTNADGCLYLWKSTWDKPRVSRLPFDKATGTIEAQWLWTDAPRSISPGASPSELVDLVHRGRPATFMYGDPTKFVLGYVEDEDFGSNDDHVPLGDLEAGQCNDQAVNLQQSEIGEESFGTEPADDTFRFRWHPPS